MMRETDATRVEQLGELRARHVQHRDNARQRSSPASCSTSARATGEYPARSGALDHGCASESCPTLYQGQPFPQTGARRTFQIAVIGYYRCEHFSWPPSLARAAANLNRIVLSRRCVETLRQGVPWAVPLDEPTEAANAR